MNSGTATTTTQAPSVNFVSRNTIVATAVTSAPDPLISGTVAPPGGLVRHQWTTSPVCESVNPVNTPIANSGIKPVRVPVHGDEERRGHDRQGPDPVVEYLPVPAEREHVRHVVVPGEKRPENRQASERCVRRESEHEGYRER